MYHEIKQKKLFERIEPVVFIDIQKTADTLIWSLSEILKSHELTPVQYNVLRILRGAEPQGLINREIAERMVNREPDMTRLLDRLEDRGLVGRSRNGTDRRVVLTRVTQKGLDLLVELDQPYDQMLQNLFSHMSKAQLYMLAELLELARQPID